jgi:hypothetical protein
MSLLTSVAFPTLHEFVRRSAGERRLNVTMMYQSPDQFAETTPDARIDLDQDRRADEEHQEACLDLSHTGYLLQCLQAVQMPSEGRST